MEKSSAGKHKRRDMIRLFLPVLLIFLLAVLWKLLLTEESIRWISTRIDLLVASRFAYPLVVLLFMGGALLGLPLNALVLATILGFGPLRGILYSLTGAMASGILLYAIGRFLGRSALHRIVQETRFETFFRRTKRAGVTTVLLLRLFPVAPYSVVSFAAGSASLSFFPYATGTLLGLLPGILALGLLGHSIVELIKHPDPVTLLAAVALLAAILTGSYLLFRKYKSIKEKDRDLLP